MSPKYKATKDNKPVPSLADPECVFPLSTTALETKLSGQRSSEDKEWEERHRMRRSALEFDSTIAARIGEFQARNPKTQTCEFVQFYLKALRDKHDTLKTLVEAEKRQFARYELRNLPKLDNKDMAGVPLELMVSTTLALYSRFETGDGLRSDISRAAAEDAWRVIHDCQDVLDEVERHRSLLNSWKNQDQVRLEYFAKERKVRWADGLREITDYNATDAPKSFRIFLEAYYGEVSWYEKQAIISDVQLPFNATALSPIGWVSSMDEFYRTERLTEHEVAVFKKTLNRYVEIGIMPPKGAKDEKATLRLKPRQQKPRA